MDTSEIVHLSFFEQNPDLVFACSNEHVSLWNVETNKKLDCISLPPKTITDMKIAPESGESGLLLVSAIQSNTISMYFSHLSNINFDESVDVIPESTKDQVQDITMNQSNEPEDDNISRMTYVRAP